MKMLEALIFLLHIFEYGYCSSPAVIDLSDNNFSSKISEAEVSLIMFYTPWCLHCKDLKPQFEQAAVSIRSQEPSIMLARINCMEGGRKICNEVNVRAYPTLHVYKNGIFSNEYDGPQDAEGIVDYMKEEVAPSPREIHSKEDLDNFIDLPRATAVGFFDTESPLKDHFIQLATKLKKKVIFGIAGSFEKLSFYNNQIVIFKPKYLHSKFESSYAVFDSDSSSDLESFILKHKHGLVGHRTKYNADEFLNPLIVAYFNVDYKRNVKSTNYWRNRIMMVAQDFINDFNFAISSKNEFPHELAEFGYNYDIDNEKPAIFARDRDSKKYKMIDEFSIETFRKFLTKFKAGELKPYLKSQPIPQNDMGAVKTVVADNFDELVTQNQKDTLIEFYAPWCVHCKNLQPVLEELGQKMVEEEVVIVKMDATDNDIPSLYDVKGFPTLYWVPKTSKQSPIIYEGGRKIENFIKYIASHATNELKRYDRDGNERPRDEL